MLLLAFVLGLAGSLHCIGMCGPIALSVPVPGKGRLSRISGILLYNGGRVLTYGVLGLLMGLIGAGAALADMQQLLSVVAGFMVIVSVALPAIFEKFLPAGNIVYRAVAFLKSSLGSFFKKRSYFSLFSIGLLNGLLPCGLVYVALAASISAPDIFSASAYMLVFGLATVPAMVSLKTISEYATPKLRGHIRKVIPVVAVLVGALLILRGLNLGIPYLSPVLDSQQCVSHCCHKN